MARHYIRTMKWAVLYVVVLYNTLSSDKKKMIEAGLIIK